MAQEPNEERRFTDKETSAILKRATELQLLAEDLPDTQGTSLKQLQQAATELGINPELIARAAREVSQGKTSVKTSALLGGPTEIEVERVVNYRISEENWPTILQEMRRVSGRLGDTHTIGKTQEWVSKSPDLLHVTVSPQGEQSRIRIVSQFGDSGVGAHIVAASVLPFFGVGLTTANMNWPLPVRIAVIMGFFLLGIFVARLGFQATGRSRQRVVDSLLTVLESQSEALESAPRIQPTYQTQIAHEPQPIQQTVGVVDRQG